MAAFTSAANGNFNAGPTWGSVNNPGTVGVDFPGTGDSATITTHTVTVPVSTTSNVGLSPTTATAAAEFVISSTGQLVVNGTINVRTPFDVTSGGIVTINGGGIFNVDPSLQATTTEYRCRFGVSGSGRLVLNDNATITAPPGYFWYHAGGAVLNAGQIDINGTAANYALVQRMQRSSSDVGWTPGLNINSSGLYEMSHVIIDACDDFSFTGTGTYTIRIEWCNWINSPAGVQNLILNTSTVTKQVYNCTFDRNPQASGGWGVANATAIDCSECYFDGNYAIGTSTGGFTDNRYNVKRSTVSGGTQNPTPFTPPSGGTRITHEILWKDTTAVNPHWGGINPSGTGARTVEGPIYLYEGSAGDGDCIMPDPSDNILTTVRNILFARNGNGGQPGTWLSQLGEQGGNHHTIAFEHCTGVVNGTSTRGISVGETTTCQADRVVSVKSNLAVEPTAGAAPGGTAGFLTQMQAAQSTNEPFTETGIDYNWIFATNVTGAATAYCSTASSPAVGTQTLPTAANDIYGEDPGFIDSFRRMPQWAQWWGTRIGASGDSVTTPGTAATAVNARLLLLAMHDGTFPESITSTCMQYAVQWIRRGWIPTNPNGRAQGHDGLTPGMFGAWAPAVTTPTVAGSTASCTTNAADGTCYWVITQSATAPDWDRVIAGRDHTGATVAAGFSGNQAVASTSIAINISGATLGGGNYYIHVTHRGAGSEAALDDYLRTSEPVTSAAFQAAGGSGSRGLGVIRSAVRSPFRSPFARRAA